jgi:hypothetical protein
MDLVERVKHLQGNPKPASVVPNQSWADASEVSAVKLGAAAKTKARPEP